MNLDVLRWLQITIILLTLISCQDEDGEGDGGAGQGAGGSTLTGGTGDEQSTGGEEPLEGGTGNEQNTGGTDGSQSTGGDSGGSQTNGGAGGSQGGTSGAGGDGIDGGTDAGNKTCLVTGCSSHICADQEMITDCMYKEEYACYQTATCERQSDGKCGWTMTSELQQCLENTGSGSLRWYQSCGDPVCGPTPTDIPDLANCTSEKEGDPCTDDGATCDPLLGCGVKLVCATQDPRTQMGGCPISRGRFKKDVAYISSEQLSAFGRQLLEIPLVTYRYRTSSSDRQHLGFILEDVEPNICVDSQRDQVDLYSYTSMAVAAIKVQAAQIEQMQHQLETMSEHIQQLESICK